MANISSNINNLKERTAFYFKVKLAVLMVSTWFLVEFLDSFFSLGLESFGLKPKVLVGLFGILSFPFIHGDWNHLLSNASSALILLIALFIFHERRSFFILLVLYLSSGAILWIIGQKGTNHIGASGLIYALAFFLFVASIRIRNRNSMALSFFIIMLYGSMIWGIMPFFVEKNVSWEGHLAGALAGTILALFEFRNYVTPIFSYETDDRPFFEKHPLP